MERIDKIIASQGKYSRSDVKGLVAKGSCYQEPFQVLRLNVFFSL